MGLLDRLLGRSHVDAANPLIGCWHMVASSDPVFEPAEAEFFGDGRLTYSILSGGKWQVMKLTYRISRSTLITNQPSAPSERHTAFTIEPDGTLRLEFGGQRSRFKQGPKAAPTV